jgi:hypothetical protein
MRKRGALGATPRRKGAGAMRLRAETPVLHCR